MGRLVLLLGLVLAMAACGGGSAETVTFVGATQTVVDTVTFEPLPTVTSITLSAPPFQMPSKNIGCTQSEDVLVCDILSGLNPEPEQSCELDWTGMEMESNAPAHPRCAGDTAYDQSAPVLPYGATWGRQGFLCMSSTTGLTCNNRDAHGFSLAREAWRAF